MRTSYRETRPVSKSQVFGRISPCEDCWSPITFSIFLKIIESPLVYLIPWSYRCIIYVLIIIFLYSNIQKTANQLIQKIKYQKRNLLGEKRHDFLLEAYRKDFEFAESIKLPTARFSYNHPLDFLPPNWIIEGSSRSRAPSGHYQIENLIISEESAYWPRNWIARRY